MRDFGLSATQVGFFFGLSGGISGLLGTLLGGLVADRFGRRNPRHYLTGPALGYLIAVPLFIVAYSMQTWWTALLFLFIPGILDSTSYGPSFAAIQGVSRPATRGTAVAVKILIQALIGGGFGPLCLGMVSDTLKGQQGDAGLRIVLQGASFGLLIVAFAYWRASLHLKAELRHLNP
jgi:MFS family permease